MNIANQQNNAQREAEAARLARKAIALSILALMLLTGCATCEQHPKTCAVVSVLAAGSLAACLNHHDSPRTHGYVLTDGKPPCTVQPGGSCR